MWDSGKFSEELEKMKLFSLILPVVIFTACWICNENSVSFDKALILSQRNITDSWFFYLTFAVILHWLKLCWRKHHFLHQRNSFGTRFRLLKRNAYLLALLQEDHPHRLPLPVSHQHHPTRSRNKVRTAWLFKKNFSVFRSRLRIPQRNAQCTYLIV